MFIIAISLFAPLREGCGPSIELTWNPFTQSCFVQVWLKFDKRIFKFRQCIFAISLLSPLMKGATFRIFFAQECFVQCGWKWPSGSWEDENMKINIHTDRQTKVKVIGKAHLSFQLSWAKIQNYKFQGRLTFVSTTKK